MRGGVLKILSFVNWFALASGALMALLFAVVCLMMLPFPQLVSQAGGEFAQVLHITGVLLMFTGVAGVATWLLQKRRSFWWLGQIALGVAVVFMIIFVSGLS